MTVLLAFGKIEAGNFGQSGHPFELIDKVYNVFKGTFSIDGDLVILSA